MFMPAVLSFFGVTHVVIYAKLKIKHLAFRNRKQDKSFCENKLRAVPARRHRFANIIVRLYFHRTTSDRFRHDLLDLENAPAWRDGRACGTRGTRGFYETTKIAAHVCVERVILANRRARVRVRVY